MPEAQFYDCSADSSTDRKSSSSSSFSSAPSSMRLPSNPQTAIPQTAIPQTSESPRETLCYSRQFALPSRSHSSTSTLPSEFSSAATHSPSCRPSSHITQDSKLKPVNSLVPGTKQLETVYLPSTPMSSEHREPDTCDTAHDNDLRMDFADDLDAHSMVRLRLSVLEPVNPRCNSRRCSSPDEENSPSQVKSRITLDARPPWLTRGTHQRGRPRNPRKTFKAKRRNTIDIHSPGGQHPNDVILTLNGALPLPPPPTPLVAATKAAKARVSAVWKRDRTIAKSVEIVKPKELPPPHIAPGPPADPRASIADILRPSIVQEQSMIGDFWPLARRLLERIFGIPEASRLDAFVQIDRKATRVFTVLILSFFNAPKGDIGIGIGPKLRALITFAASSACGCTYWLGHAAMMHSVFGHQPSVPPSQFSVLATLKSADPSFPVGDINSRERDPKKQARHSQQGALRQSLDWGRDHVGRALRGRPALEPASCSPAEVAAVRLASAMSTIPHTVTQDLVDDVLKLYGGKHSEQIMLLVSAMGFLNRWVDLVDVGIEWDCYKYHEANATEMGAIAWGKHFKVKELEEDRRNGSPARANKLSGPRRFLTAMSRPMDTLRLLCPSSRLDREWLSSVPSTAYAQREYMHDRIGFYPYYLDAIVHDKRALRGLIYVLDHTLFSASDDLPKYMRALMCLVLARFARCDTLTAHFAYLAHRFGATEQQIQYCSEWDYLSSWSKALLTKTERTDKCVFIPLHVSALLLAHCSKGTPSRVRAREVWLLQEHMSHATIAEAVTVISLFMVIQRWTAVNRSSHLEPVVHQFAESPLGHRLGIPREMFS